MTKSRVTLPYARPPARARSRSVLTVASFLLASGLLMSWLVLPRSRVTAYPVIIGLPVAALLGIAAAIHTRIERRPGIVIAIIATSVAGVGILIVLGSVFAPLLRAVMPETTTTIT